MVWTNSMILGLGGLLVAIPVILHFLMRPKPKQLIFPAMQFLKERQHANRSRTRLRHLLLLILRCLLIGLVALALAGPTVASREFGNWLTLGGIGFSGFVVGLVLLAAFFRPTKNWLLIGIFATLFLGHVIFGGWSATKLLGSDSADLLGDSQAPVAALIVLDTSPRMQYLSENQTRLDVAKEIGLWLISQFPVDSQVCVLATDNDRPFFSVDVVAAARRIETLESTYVEHPIPAAMAEGLKILEDSPQERKEIYILTDLTRQSWVGGNTKPVLKQLEQNPGMSLFVIDVGVENPTNFALSSLEIKNVEIAQNGKFNVATQISRNGDAAQRTVKMLIEKPEPPRPVVRDGVVLFPESFLAEQSATVDIRENGSAQVPYQFSESLPLGTYHGRIEIEGQDGLAIDDQRFFTFRVSPSWKILVVSPAGVSPQNLLSSISTTVAQELGTSIYDCTVLSQAELVDYPELDEFDGVFLLNPKPLDEAGWQKLEKYVTAGGGLAICLGSNAAKGPFADPTYSTESARRLLTGQLEQQWDAGENAEPFFLSPRDFSHPLFKTFRNIETSLLWNLFPVYKHWGILPDQNSEFPTQTLLSFSNREPALIERQIGSGRVLVLTTPITERGSERNRRIWNELFRGRFFPAWLLVRAMTSYLVQNDTESLNIKVGQIASFDNDLRQYPEVYQVYTPRADKLPTTVNTVEGQIRYRFTDDPGQYRLKGVEDPVLRGFSVNLPESSTDLTRIEPDELDGILGPDRYQMATQQNEIQRQQGTTRRGQEFYPLLLLMMMVVFAVEYLMSNRFYRTV
jgi:hypothetical protein